MTTPVPTAAAALEFLQDVQLLLDEGVFVSTYKFALLSALADLAVEKGDVGGCVLAVSEDEIAEKVIESYWRQVTPYPVPGASAGVLLQNSGRQAAIVGQVREMHSEAGGFLAAAKSDSECWRGLVRGVARTIRVMPLWKLQIVRGGVHDFLYPNLGHGRSIELRPGVAYCLRVFHGLVQGMVQGAWLRWVRGLRQNANVLGQSVDLQEFLFGSDRGPLVAYVPLLRELQEGRCFYCKGTLQARGEVDHFIPWVRYPLDLGHNFVLAHRQCNSDKRAVLAGVPHLKHWLARNRIHDSRMRSYFAGNALPHDLTATESVARWAYEQTERVGGSVWIRYGSPAVRLESEWRGCW